MGGADPGRPRRRRDQDRAHRRGRRHARLGTSVRRRRGRRADVRRLLSFVQSRQALGRARFRDRGRPAHREEARGALGRRHRELQDRRACEVRARLRGAVEGEPAPRLLLGHRLRPGRPVQASRRLRPAGAGHGRHHGPDRAAGRRTDARRRRLRGRDDRHLFGRRNQRGAERAQHDRQGQLHRHGAARHAGRRAGEPGIELSGQRQGAKAHGQRAPRRGAVPGVSGLGRPRDHRVRQRLAVRTIDRAARRARYGAGRALSHQRGTRGQSRHADPAHVRDDRQSHARRSAGEAGSGRRARRPDQYAGRRVRRSAGAGAQDAHRPAEQIRQGRLDPGRALADHDQWRAHERGPRAAGARESIRKEGALREIGEA